MSSHEVLMRTMANDTIAARRREAANHRLAKRASRKPAASRLLALRALIRRRLRVAPQPAPLTDMAC
ncbi:MAG: hypothetical protein R3300_03545 [Candidatus Promineifilaceae bacterium]|nr:hypothetical protein [Candidatus Promineifilaceae bacterium]